MRQDAADRAHQERGPEDQKCLEQRRVQMLFGWEELRRELRREEAEERDKAIIRSDRGVLTCWGAFPSLLGLVSHTRRRGSFLRRI